MIHDLTTENVETADLRTYHRNPRQGATKTIAASLRANGQYRPIVVNRGTHTGRPHEVLAGNHTLAAARDEGWTHLAVSYVDVDDDQAARIVTADNKTADLGSYDDRLLAELLSDLDHLDGTGYTESDLDDLLAGLEETPDAPGKADSNADESEHGASISDLAQQYDDRTMRSIVLTYDTDTYPWIVERLGQLAEQNGLESNADVVARLLVDAEGDE